MHAIAFLKQEHRKAQAAFREIETASEHERDQLWSRLRPELELHERMEETHLYGPVAREVKAEGPLADWEQTHQEDVEEAENLIGEIDGLESSDDEWSATVKKLHGALEQHIRTEEQKIWPAIERVRDAARLEQAGRQMEAMKSEQAKAAH